MKPWLLYIKDKVKILTKEGKEIFCPPHHIPHKLPFTEPISDEPCHYHNAKWRMAHHIPTCKFILKCPHYKTMKEAYKNKK